MILFQYCIKLYIFFLFNIMYCGMVIKNGWNHAIPPIYLIFNNTL